VASKLVVIVVVVDIVGIVVTIVMWQVVMVIIVMESWLVVDVVLGVVGGCANYAYGGGW